MAKAFCLAKLSRERCSHCRACSLAHLDLFLLQIEIYCEKLKDLLDPKCADLSIQRDSTHGCHVMGARERPARFPKDMLDTVEEGLANRVSVLGLSSDTA